MNPNTMWQLSPEDVDINYWRTPSGSSAFKMSRGIEHNLYDSEKTNLLNDSGDGFHSETDNVHVRFDFDFREGKSFYGIAFKAPEDLTNAPTSINV